MIFFGIALVVGSLNQEKSVSRFKSSKRKKNGVNLHKGRLRSIETYPQVGKSLGFTISQPAHMESCNDSAHREMHPSHRKTCEALKGCHFQI